MESRLHQCSWADGRASTSLEMGGQCNEKEILWIVVLEAPINYTNETLVAEVRHHGQAAYVDPDPTTVTAICSGDRKWGSASIRGGPVGEMSKVRHHYRSSPLNTSFYLVITDLLLPTILHDPSRPLVYHTNNTGQRYNHSLRHISIILCRSYDHRLPTPSLDFI